jgi:hypothetical protein
MRPELSSPTEGGFVPAGASMLKSVRAQEDTSLSCEFE